MNRQGFTLIEVLIALAITGFMSTILFTALFQINTSVTLTESLMTVNEKAARLQQLFERDLSGATTLIDNEPPKKQDKDLKATPTGGSQDQDTKPAAKKEKKITKKIFYGTTKGSQVGTLTFVSNNPLLGFWSTQSGSFQAGKAKPCLVRITYGLEEDPKKPGSYILTRQESIPLDFEQRSGRSYEVMDGIKNLSFKYTAKTIKTVEVKEEKKLAQGSDKDKPQKQPQKTKEEITYTANLTTWNSDEITELETKKDDQKKEELKERKLPIPVFVDIEAVLWDDTQQREYPYVFTLEIIADTEFIQKRRPWAFMSSFQQQPQQDPKNQSRTSTQPGQGKLFNTQYRPSSGLQKQLEDVFKTAQSLDQRIAT